MWPKEAVMKDSRAPTPYSRCLEALRENDGAEFATCWPALRANPAPEMQELYQRFLRSPDFRDFVPH